MIRCLESGDIVGVLLTTTPGGEAGRNCLVVDMCQAIVFDVDV